MTAEPQLLLCPEWGGYDLTRAAALLAPILGQPRPDTARLLRRSPGLLLEDLRESVAMDALAVMQELGVPARLVPSAEVPELPTPGLAQGAELTPAELQLRLPGNDGPARLPWDGESLQLVSAAVLLQARPLADPGTSRRRSPDGDEFISAIAAASKRASGGLLMEEARQRVRGFLQAREEGVPGQRLELHLDLATTDGAIHRILSDMFEYRCLGVQASSSSLTNMLTLAALLHARLDSRVPRTPGFEELAAGDPSGAAFPSLEDYHLWLRWCLARQRHGS